MEQNKTIVPACSLHRDPIDCAQCVIQSLFHSRLKLIINKSKHIHFQSVIKTPMANTTLLPFFVHHQSIFAIWTRCCLLFIVYRCGQNNYQTYIALGPFSLLAWLSFYPLAVCIFICFIIAIHLFSFIFFKVHTRKIRTMDKDGKFLWCFASFRLSVCQLK